MGMKALAVLLAVATGCCGLNIELKIQNDPQCMFKGQQCSADLAQVIYCSAKGGDSYVVTTCKSGTSCLASSGSYICSTKGQPRPPNQPTANNTVFRCHGTEAFPDPNKCNTAYLCESSGIFPKFICECPEDSALVFSPGMTCNTNEDVKRDCMCPRTNRCKDGAGPGGFDKCHPEFYFVCREESSGMLVPEVYKCPSGQTFHQGKCQKLELSAQAVEEESGKDPVCKKYHPPCIPELNVSCSKRGELLPHKENDRCYYFCNSNLKPEIKDCGVGSYFTCKYGQCGCVFGPKLQ